MEPVLNLSTFGEVIKRPGESKPDKKDHDADGNVYEYSSVVKCVLEYTAQIKLLHWQTLSYSEHKTLDKLGKSYKDLGDTLIETISGKYGRPKLSKDDSSIKIGNYHDPQIDGLHPFVQGMIDCYKQECKPKFNPDKDPEIINILDEILALLEKTKYLLTLK